jgi:hypothetical protein
VPALLGGNGPPTTQLGDTVQRVITRALGITVVLSGIVFAGAGVAAADPTPPTGGDKSSAQPSCGAGDIDFAKGCFFGMGRFF